MRDVMELTFTMTPPPYHGTDRSRAGELERLAALHSSGALTDDAFAAAKGRILSAEATCVARP